ncbi:MULTISPECIES: hypothetical protein [unclassified Nonomuraea]|uniref:hypothetical protein n=1 Tax=unclassified Nonomuraea TaxID=2593643 RepID=UPI0033D9BEC4
MPGGPGGAGGDTVRVADHYVDFVVGPPVLAAAQAFADKYLQGEGHHGPEWPDFPPAALSAVREVEIPRT